MVETTAVQAVAVQRNPGDSLAMDRGTSPSSTGLVFDLISLAAKPNAPAADLQTSAPPVAPDQAGATVLAFNKPEGTAALPTALTADASAGDGPISVDALVAMDKTARQGLSAKPFVEKPAVEWMISVLSAAGLVKSKPDGVTADAVPPTALPGQERPVIEANSKAVPPTDAALLADPSPVAVADDQLALKVTAEPVPTLPLVPDMPTPAEPSAPVKAVVPALLAAPSDTPSAETAANSVGILTDALQTGSEVTVKSQTVDPSPTKVPSAASSPVTSPQPPSPLVIEPVAPLAQKLEPSEAIAVLAAPRIDGLAQAPSPLTAAPVAAPEAQPVAAASEHAEPAQAAAVSSEKALPGNIAAPVDVSVLAAQPVVVQTTSALSTAETTPPSTTEAVHAPKVSASKKVEHGTKAHLTDPADGAMAPVAAAPNLVVPMPTPAQEIKPQPDAAETPAQDERKPLGHRAKATEGSVDRPLANEPGVQSRAKPTVTPSPVTFDGKITNKDQISVTASNDPSVSAPLAEKPDHVSPAPAVSVAERPTTEGTHSPIIAPITAPTNAPTIAHISPQMPNMDENSGSDSRQASAMPRFEGETGSGTGFQNSSSNQQGFGQGFGQSSGSAASATPLPDHVTVEAVTIRSQHSEHDDGPSNAVLNAKTADQSGPISVFTDVEPAKLAATDLMPRPSTTSGNGGTSTTSASPTAPSPIRVDNPIFIAQRDKALQQQIISALRSGHDEIRLSLYPPQLGQVTINMALDGQKVKVGVKTANREATNLLVGERQTLASALGHEGFTLEGFDVADDAPKERTPNDHPIQDNFPTSPKAAESSFSLDITI